MFKCRNSCVKVVWSKEDGLMNHVYLPAAMGRNLRHRTMFSQIPRLRFTANLLFKESHYHSLAEGLSPSQTEPENHPLAHELHRGWTKDLRLRVYIYIYIY